MEEGGKKDYPVTSPVLFFVICNNPNTSCILAFAKENRYKLKKGTVSVIITGNTNNGCAVTIPFPHCYSFYLTLIQNHIDINN